MFPRRQSAESPVGFDLLLSVARIGEELENISADYTQKTRRLTTEKISKKKISSRMLRHAELPQNSEFLGENDCSIKLIVDQHHSHSNHNVKIFANGASDLSKKNTYDLNRRKAYMKDILQPTGSAPEVRCSEIGDALISGYCYCDT